MVVTGVPGGMPSVSAMASVAGPTSSERISVRGARPVFARSS